jgi:hypothetical protein
MEAGPSRPQPPSFPLEGGDRGWQAMMFAPAFPRAVRISCRYSSRSAGRDWADHTWTTSESRSLREATVRSSATAWTGASNATTLAGAFGAALLTRLADMDWVRRSPTSGPRHQRRPRGPGCHPRRRDALIAKTKFGVIVLAGPSTNTCRSHRGDPAFGTGTPPVPKYRVPPRFTARSTRSTGIRPRPLAAGRG